jgi:hypothetical protein
MVNRRSSDAAPAQTPVAPVVKRKRRASCLGEQTHIAELERTIQILRDQDRNGTTASLLSEIDVLRTENERLRDVIDSVKSVIGCDAISRNTATNDAIGNDGGSGHSPAGSSVGMNDLAFYCTTNEAHSTW